MEYIVHHRFRTIAACGQHMNIPYGAKFETIGDYIATSDGKGICAVTSEDAQMHFAWNDDGLGLERGARTYAIAYSQRKRKWPDKSIHRFSEEEVNMLESRWKHWLRQDVDTILFNDAFFAAQPDELQRLADALKIKVRR